MGKNSENNVNSVEITQAELDWYLGLKTVTSDIITEHIFMNNKNNALYTEIVNEVQKIYGFEPISKVDKTTVQKADAPEVLDDKKMIADITGESVRKFENRIKLTNIGMEIQKEPQHDFPERIVLSFSNRTKMGLKSGKEYEDAPDVIQLGFSTSKLKNLSDNKNFVSCIDLFTIRETGRKLFPDDKYQMFLIELSKMPRTKKNLDEKYHALWDICKVLKTPHKDMERTIKMANITNATALTLSQELRSAVISPQVNEWEQRRRKALQDRERERQEREREREKYKEHIAALEEKLFAEQQARQAEQKARQAEQQARQAAEAKVEELERRNQATQTAEKPKTYTIAKREADARRAAKQAKKSNSSPNNETK
ncbi:MAG: Rpn family recombination-promoting nuclease/putative transposase [Turicibacter sp.]|nr:Rpn family recombination-promoting nuclease/putative transposase [Turicibacter sp.]